MYETLEKIKKNKAARPTNNKSCNFYNTQIVSSKLKLMQQFVQVYHRYYFKAFAL